MICALHFEERHIILTAKWQRRPPKTVPWNNGSDGSTKGRPFQGPRYPCGHLNRVKTGPSKTDNADLSRRIGPRPCIFTSSRTCSCLQRRRFSRANRQVSIVNALREANEGLDQSNLEKKHTLEEGEYALASVKSRSKKATTELQMRFEEEGPTADSKPS